MKMVDRTVKEKNSSVMSSAGKSFNRPARLKKGWSKIKKTVKTICRVLSRKSKPLDLTFQYNVETSQATDPCVVSGKSAERRKELNATYTIETESSDRTGGELGRFRHYGDVRGDIRNSEPCHRLNPFSDNHSADAKRASFGKFKLSYWPEVAPPTTSKSELFSSTGVFRKIDRRALQFARSEWTDLKKMARKLIRNCNSDLEKARVLFRWVVARDLIVRNAGSLNWTVSTVNDGSELKHSRELFHKLFQILCGYAGLPCEIIRGYSKGAGYKPGMRIRGETFRNSWTAVAIDGTWRLVNCTWAARQVDGVKLNSCDEFYFLTDPHEHIFQHFPDDPKWQLLEEPLPSAEFTKLPLVWSPFFNNSLRFSKCYSSTIVADNEKAEIRLKVPKHVTLGSQLRRSRQTPMDEPAGVSLTYVNDEAIFTVLSRQPGLFYFSVYASGPESSRCLENACSFAIRFKHEKMATPFFH